MSFGTALYTILLKPLQLIFETVYSIAYEYIGNAGLSIIALSLAINFLVLPLYQRADAMQEEERETEAKLNKWVTHIKKTFRGDERTMMLQTYYRQNHYSPTYVLRGAASLFLEIPFFIAAYRFLSELELLEGVSFGPIADLSQADGLIVLGGITINLLPFVMTGINFISSAIFSKNYPLKTKIQLYTMAAFFLVFLYDSPSGLVFYWTLNNLFSLVKTIFYKLKNPRFVLSVLAAISSVSVIAFAGKLFLSGSRRVSIFTAFVAVCLWLPLILSTLKKHGKLNHGLPYREPNRRIFVLGGLFLAVLTGILIPSAVIKASPQEFMDVTCFVHPLWYLVHSFLTAIGLFVFWFGVFYWLVDEKTKPVYECAVWGFCGIAVVNYLFFGTDLGLLNSNLKFDNEFVYSLLQIGFNSIAAIAILSLMSLIYLKWKKAVTQMLSVALAAFMCMSVMNCAGIYQSVASVDLGSLYGNEGDPHFTLSQNGKNVVVIMLDRGMGEYVPYMFNEKPELKEQFDGFVYYSNVTSFGSYTNFGTPALYGGYEYTPIEMNKRSEESLESKQNEALKVMPVLFDSKDYDVTVLDPTYAGYQWTPDLSIYDEYPDIHKYISMGYFSDSTSKEEQILNRNRNFFLYGLMKSAPLIAQRTIYNYGKYNQNYQNSISAQVIENIHNANGISSSFMNAYNVLINLSYMTNITDSENGSFLMMSNDITHEPMLLSESEYTPSEQVDNTKYDKDNCSRFIINGRELKVENENQMKHYQSNMAAMLQLGKWFDYLRETDVYDNTRIIVVSDHGRSLNQIEGLVLDDGTDSLSDLEFFYPLLLVKDFDSTGFTTSDEFMTNADVPTLATESLFDNPENPMTGKVIDNSEKYAHDQYIIASHDWDTSVNNGTTFLPARWYTVHDSIWEKSNWTLVAENAVLPLDDEETN